MVVTGAGVALSVLLKNEWFSTGGSIWGQLWQCHLHIEVSKGQVGQGWKHPGLV